MTRFPVRVVALLAAAVVVASCGDRASLGPPTDQPQALWGFEPVGVLLGCTAIPADSVSQVIGPEGGTIYVGPHKLRVPEGSLAEPVTITAVAPSDTVNRVVLSPHGLQLAEPARLTLSYANCGVVNWLLPKRIAYTTDALEILQILLSLDNPLARRVSANLDHFSTYAVAW